MASYNQQNPYADYSGNPYGSGQTGAPPPANQYATGQYAPPSNQYVAAGGSSALSNQDFLSRVEACKADIRTLTTHVGQIASMHQRTLSAPDSSSSSQLESVITQTQVLNSSIRDQIKFLETDAARSRDNNVKNTQVAQLKTSFTKQLQEYRQEEVNYERRYREQIARQYRIVNPEATEAEVQQAQDADWGNEGVFQQAVSPTLAIFPRNAQGAFRLLGKSRKHKLGGISTGPIVSLLFCRTLLCSDLTRH